MGGESLAEGLLSPAYGAWKIACKANGASFREAPFFKAKYYHPTKSGRKQLEVETDRWERLAAAVGQILETA